MSGKNWLLISLTGLLFIACTNGDVVSDNNQKSVEIKEDGGDLVYDAKDYASDWIEIRESILASDTASLEKFIDTPDTEPESLITICAEDWVVEVLIDKPYEELLEVDYNGDLVKEFSADMIQDIDGVEYGAELYLYFKETRDGLRLTGIIYSG